MGRLVGKGGLKRSLEPLDEEEGMEEGEDVWKSRFCAVYDVLYNIVGINFGSCLTCLIGWGKTQTKYKQGRVSCLPKIPSIFEEKRDGDSNFSPGGSLGRKKTFQSHTQY